MRVREIKRDESLHIAEHLGDDEISSDRHLCVCVCVCVRARARLRVGIVPSLFVSVSVTDFFQLISLDDKLKVELTDYVCLSVCLSVSHTRPAGCC